MKKSKLLIMLVLPFFAFSISIFGVQAGDRDVVWDLDEGEGSNSTSGGCDSSGGNVCRGSGKSSYPQYLYASLSNPASSSSLIVGQTTGTITENVKYLNGVHDSITANKASVCSFIGSTFGIDCNSPEICEEGKNDYVYFSMSAPIYVNKKLISNMTVKEVAAKCGNGWSCNNSGLGTMSMYFHVTGANTGVYSQATSRSTSASEIANVGSGYGVAAIRLRDYGTLCGEEVEPAMCPGNGIGQTGALGACADDNYGTESVFRDVAQGSGTDSEQGKREYDIGGEGEGYCSLYCMEINATANLPGGFANAITLGTGIIWPTSERTWTSMYGNMFPLKFHGTRRCYIQVAPNLTYGRMCQVDPIKDYTDALNDLKSAYNNTSDAKPAGDKARKYIGTYKSVKGYGHSYKTRDIDPVNGSKTTKYLVKSYGGGDSKAPGKNNDSLRTLTFLPTCWNFAGVNDKPDYQRPPNTCGDAALWNPYIIPTDENVAGLNSAYEDQKAGFFKANKAYPNTVVQKICIGQIVNGKCNNEKLIYGCTSNVNGFTGHLVGSAEHYDSKGCDFKDGDQFQDSGIKETYDALQAWKAFQSALKTKQSQFKTYVDAYREAVNIYLKVKMCSDFSKGAGETESESTDMICSGSFCNYYNFMTNANMEYEMLEDDGMPTWVPLTIEQDVNYSCEGCGEEAAPMKKKQYMYEKYENITKTETPSRLQQYINMIENHAITMESGEVVWGLDVNSASQYAYIDKRTLEVSSEVPSNSNKVLNSFISLPTSFNNVPGRQYNLVLEDIMLGHNGNMSAQNSGVSIRDYICHYEVTTTNDECLCPPGTKNWGIDLFQAVLNDNSTCADAREKYCDNGNIPECTTNCFEDKYCPDDYTTKISGCINSGQTRDWCINKLCNGPYSGIAYRCPSNSHNAGMDITTCVEMKVSTGYSTTAAKANCERTICQLDNIVIYRTIDLKNPFPSIDADDDRSKIQAGLRIGMFNLNINGRYPGYNWNGTNLVHNEIIKNRDVSDDDVFKQKPLYHFELNSARIVEIRNYNQHQAINNDGYNDFTLECIKDDNNPYVGAACLSRKVVHNPNFGGDTTGDKSLCGGAGSTASLASCLYSS